MTTSNASRFSSSRFAYHHTAAHPDDELVQVTRGTPTGEYLRRYWHPVGLSSEVTSRPQKVRILGEDLVLFRDKSGRPGLLYPRCMHRGTTLYFGKVEEQGIRCCYHGWLFSVEGHCLDQPCEPGGGLHREAARQPWYPLEERYGLVFAYMGPPEKKPVLPLALADHWAKRIPNAEVQTFAGAGHLLFTESLDPLQAAIKFLD